MQIYFGIDCAPGAMRPDAYAMSVFEKLETKPIAPYSKCFGAWGWKVPVSSNFNFREFDSWMKGEMDRLCDAGKIRGAQWDKI